jgi:hypothetical protein
MGTDNQNFFKWKEDSFFLQITIEDAQSSLSSYKAYWAMAPTATGPAVLVKTTPGDFSDEGGITWATGTMVRIQIDEEDTADLDIAEYYHELTLEDPSGNSVVTASGTFDLKQALFPSIYR